MTDSRSAIQSLMGERGHLRSSHEMLQAALESESRDESFVPFYISVANYMEASMRRLDAQDIKMLNRIADKLGDITSEQEEIIAEVHRRLDGNREHLQSFLACRNTLRADPADLAAIEDFESASRAYIEYIHNRMGHHAPSTELARELLDETDWIDIADIDEDYFATEKILYGELIENRPDSVPPGLAADEYSGQHRND